MNSKKLNWSIGMIWAISLLLGFIYNALILPLTMHGTGCEYIVKFITYLICLSGSGMFLWWVSNKILQHGAGKMFILTFVPLSLAAIILHYTTGMDEIMGSTLVIGVLFFLYSHCLTNYIGKPYGLIKLLGLMVLSIIAGYITGGFSMYYLTLVTIFVTSLLAVFVYDIPNSKKYYWSFSLMAFAVYFISPFIFVVSPLKDLVLGFFAPKSSDVYVPIVEQLNNIKLFKFDIFSNFANTLNYNGSSTYMHITAMFGIIAAIIIILTQIVGVYLMIRRAKQLNNKQNRIFGVMMSVIIGMQILLSIGSSFCRLPINDSGAPFLTYKGLELSLVPLLLYVLNIKKDSSDDSFKSEKKINTTKRKEKKPFYVWLYEFLGLDECSEQIEEWRR